MLTNEEVEYLLGLNKVLKDPYQIIDLGIKKNRLELISYEDNDYQFWLEITSNKKIVLKTSIHHMETNNFTGLLRIDFKGAHKNPEEVKHTVPEYMKKYAGLWIDYDVPHMHIFVEGYRPLVWAMPLEDTDFPINQLNDMGDLPLLINSFANKINLSSMLNIQQAIF